MHSDQPTIPNLRRYEPGETLAPAAPGELPPWPVAGERTQRGLRADRPVRRDAPTLLLGMSLGANAALLAVLLGLLLLSHAGYFSPGGSPVASARGASSPSVALSSPTATSSATALAGGWLRVEPGSVRLGCADGQRTQFVVLENTGPETVRWRADLAVSADQANVAVSPDHGKLEAGASMPLQIQNAAHADEQQGGSGQQGVIRFDPTTPDAGPAPSLSFTTVGCQ